MSEVEKTVKDGRVAVRALTLKQRRFIQFLATAPTITEAARQAGYAYPNKNACHVMNRLKNHPEFTATLEAAGLSTNMLANSIAEGIKATKKYVWKGKVVGEIPDWKARLRALLVAAKMAGYLK